MFSTIIKEVGGFFDRRFLVTTFFPNIAFWSLIIFTLLFTKIDNPILIWESISHITQILFLLIFIGFVIFSSLLLSSMRTIIIRIYMGNWSDIPILNWFDVKLFEERINKRNKKTFLGRLKYLLNRRSYYQDVLIALDRQRCDLYNLQINSQEKKDILIQEIEHRMYHFFPPITHLDKVMPTQFGNILKSAELYGFVRYKMDAQIFWPRLHTVLPTDMVVKLSDELNNVDFMLAISMFSSGFCVIGGIIALVNVASPITFLLITLISPLLSWIAYRGAVASALTYSNYFKTSFDLYRLALLGQFGLAQPKSLEEEIELWKDLGFLIYRGLPTSSLSYVVQSSQDKNT